MPSLVTLLALLAGAPTVRADILPLDDARPWLASGGAPVDWAAGGGAFLLASAPVVRLNYRGVTTEQPRARLRDLSALGWAGTHCNLSARGLCASEMGVAFPTAPAAPRATDEARSLPPDWQALACARAEGRVVTHTPVYELSACDLLDEGADVLYSAGVLYVRNSALSPWVYWALIVGAILLVRTLARNVQAHLGQAEPDASQVGALAASLVCILLVSHEGGALYATEADYVFYVATMVYCLAYLGYHALFLVHAHALGMALAGDPGPQPPVFNLAAGVLQLIVSRLYTGAESPYNPIILLILCTRALTKLRRPSAGHALTALADASYVALACDLGFLPDPAYLVALVACADLIAELYFVGARAPAVSS
jgi:hypothetical protein